MDYLRAPLTFRIKKVCRYCRLYGPRRTLAKVRGQLHMKKTFNTLPPFRDAADDRHTVGIIGCGNYAFSNIAYYLRRRQGKVIRGVMDIDINRAASLFQSYTAAYYTTDPEKLLSDDAIDLVYIASNHASHAEYAISALARNKNVYIEKPHVVSEEQLVRLMEAMKTSDGKVFLGFNRPQSRFGGIIREMLAAESGPAIYSWFVVGHDLPPEHWYNSPEEGGRVPGNLCHWTDFILSLTTESIYPIEINPTSGAQNDRDIAVTFKFSDGTVAVITFSVKGHPFEGVRERFSAHKGNCLLEMSDFQTLKTEVADRVRKYTSFYRDQGHEANIVSCFKNVHESLPYDGEAQVAYIWNTGMLFLKTKQALETGAKVTVRPYSSDAAARGEDVLERHRT